MRAALLSITMAVAVASCTNAPVTGRRQFIALPEAQVSAQGAQAYDQIRSQKRVSTDPQLTAIVNEIGFRIAAVSRNPNADWEFTVFEDPSPNAFALPGGKVGVFTGLFEVAQDEAQLAAVLAHEVGHVDARHSAERATRQMGEQLLVRGVSSAIGASGASAQVLAAASTLALTLPFSRNQEAEADAIGLQYMAAAGYDPRAAIAVWENFEARGSRGPEFLATHPNPGNRIANLQAQMPEALAIYEQSGGFVQ